MPAFSAPSGDRHIRDAGGECGSRRTSGAYSSTVAQNHSAHADIALSSCATTTEIPVATPSAGRPSARANDRDGTRTAGIDRAQSSGALPQANASDAPKRVRVFDDLAITLWPISTITSAMNASARGTANSVLPVLDCRETTHCAWGSEGRPARGRVLFAMSDRRVRAGSTQMEIVAADNER